MLIMMYALGFMNRSSLYDNNRLIITGAGDNIAWYINIRPFWFLYYLFKTLVAEW